MSLATSTASPTVSLGHTSYAQLLNKIIHRLDKAGCEEIVPLPRIAVIGNQSSGKSSLIEAICQIKVPRANGTCTRCPMEVRLSTLNKPEWSGKIRLKKEVRTESGDTELQLQLFTAVTDPREVPLALKRAQLALLNPSKDSTDFLRYSDSECTEAAPRAERKFSSNIVVLEITGADVDVSFIDLPGIIQRNRSEIDDVSMVKELATSYAERENCLILVVTSMKDDIDNQAAGEIAKNADPYQQRTIGVLTKADEVRHNADKEYWAQVALNKTPGAILHHGYYVTRLATPDELRQNPTWNESRERERDFFEGAPIWGPPIRCGTELLTSKLSELLSKKIKLSLRDIEKELLRKQRAISKELSALPAIDEDPQTALVTLCGEFTHELGQFVDGNGSRPEYILQMRPKFVALQKLIDETKPKILADNAANVKNGLSIPKVKKLINDKRIKHFPGDVPNAVILVLVDEFASTWSDICSKWFKDIEELSRQFMEWLLDEYFASHRNTGLYDEVKDAIEQTLRHVGKDTLEKMNFCCLMEKNRSFSLIEDDHLREFKRLKPEVLQGLSLKSDSNASPIEVNIICNVYTYFHLASRRIIETIPMICEMAFAHGLGEKMRKDLTKTLGIIGKDGNKISENFMQDEQGIRDKKRELDKRKKIMERSLSILEAARSELRGLEFSDEEFQV